MQETSFPFEIIVHDDCSTDGTTDIIREYERQYPQLIKPIYQSENQFSKGIKIFAAYVWPKTRGKYIAACEGDDYWIDPYKLQKQFDFLEGHPECSMCAHNNGVIIGENETIIGQKNPPGQKQFYDLNDVLGGHPWHTSTIVYKKEILNSFPDWYGKLLGGDWQLYIIAAQQGSIGYIDEVMSIYRVHPGGIWSSMTIDDQHKFANQRLELLLKNLGGAYRKKTLGNQFKQAAARYFEIEILSGTPAWNTKNGAKYFLEQLLLKSNLSYFQKIRLKRIFNSNYYGALGFKCYQEKNLKSAARFLMMACILDPLWLRNKGTLSILGEFIIGRNVADYFRKRL